MNPQWAKESDPLNKGLYSNQEMARLVKESIEFYNQKPHKRSFPQSDGRSLI